MENTVGKRKNAGHPEGHKVYMGLYRENFRNLPVLICHKAQAYQILHVALLGMGIASGNCIMIYCDTWVCIGIQITIYRETFYRVLCMIVHVIDFSLPLY